MEASRPLPLEGHRTDSAGASSSSGVEFADDDLRKLVVEQLQREIDEYNKKIVRLETLPR